MDSLQSIKSRSKAVKNIGQISKAMEVVAATKMRKAQEAALNSRHYAYEALRILHEITRSAPLQHELLETRPIAKTLVVIVASDRGLAGSFNTQVFRETDALFSTDERRDASAHFYCVMTIGKKALSYALKNKLEIVDSFSKVGDYRASEQIDPLASVIVDGFLDKKWDRVIAVSTHFRTTLKQETLTRQILPVDVDKIKETVRELIPEHGRYAEQGGELMWTRRDEDTEYLFEPDPKSALNVLLPRLVAMQVYHLVLEANASEHSARMIAMKNASDNADDVSYGLTLSYNKARQAVITKELVESVATQSAVAS